MPAPAAIAELVQRFRDHHEVYTSGAYNETQLRRDFLDPFFAALGWDVHNSQGYAAYGAGHAPPSKMFLKEHVMNLEELVNSPPAGDKTGAYDYKSHQIVFIDLKGVQPEAIESRVEQAKKIIFSSPPDSVLLLTDFRDMRYDKQRTEYAKQVSIDIKPFVKKSALLGIEGMKKIIMQSMIIFSGRTNMKPFPDATNALEWLIRP